MSVTAGCLAIFLARGGSWDPKEVWVRFCGSDITITAR
ncbi:Protein of unknown function [Pyronema omphalodes CBS 100304]|uniref:Uncharacterized protein n=1 Tax=Pyronema omphalodes (strain CBS 100304) TaxID=1076935 RepID=U4LB06_PYROM|nr:Protein of unknown function [Pyronema omphalodes CBS 100304]